MGQHSLVIVSNRGPIRFLQGADGGRIAKRGGGGLVTALSGVAQHQKVTWVAAALTDEDEAVAEEGAYVDGNLRLRLVALDREQYDRYYNVVSNPMLWEDFADVDIIRVDNVYYASASTMHYSPGAPVLRSYDLGETTAQIAYDLHIAEGTVKSRLHYALRTLRLTLREMGVSR